MFLEISQNSQENTCTRVSFLIKLHAFIKKETLGQMFSCDFCEISKNNFLQNTSGRLLLKWIDESAFSCSRGHVVMLIMIHTEAKEAAF